MKNLSSLVRGAVIVAGAICMLGALTQCGPQNDRNGMAGGDPSDNGKSADPTARVSNVKEERTKDPQEEALRFGHEIDSDFDKRIALQCYDAMHVQNPEMPNQVQEPKAYTISQMQETGVWTAHIIFRSGQGWKGAFCDFNASGDLQIKDVYNY